MAKKTHVYIQIKRGIMTQSLGRGIMRFKIFFSLGQAVWNSAFSHCVACGFKSQIACFQFSFPPASAEEHPGTQQVWAQAVWRLGRSPCPCLPPGQPSPLWASGDRARRPQERSLSAWVRFCHSGFQIEMILKSFSCHLLNSPKEGLSFIPQWKHIPQKWLMEDDLGCLVLLGDPEKVPDFWLLPDTTSVVAVIWRANQRTKELSVCV